MPKRLRVIESPGKDQSRPTAHLCGLNPKLRAGGLMAIGLVFVAFGIHTFVAEAGYVPSGSMKPTIQIDDQLIVDKVSYHLHTPQRYDIVVLNPTAPLLKLNFHAKLIKRIVGLPGEQVQIKQGRVYINQQPLQENYLATKMNYAWGPKMVPPNSYLVLGDNRNNSYDSHRWGFVPRDRIIGRAIVRYWPLKRMDLLLPGQK